MISLPHFNDTFNFHGLCYEDDYLIMSTRILAFRMEAVIQNFVRLNWHTFVFMSVFLPQCMVFEVQL